VKAASLFRLHGISLRSQIMILLSVCIVLIGITTSLVVRNEVEQEILVLLQDERQRVTSLIGSASIESMISEDVPALETLVSETMKKERVIASISFLNESGNVLAGGDRGDLSAIDEESLFRTSHEISFIGEHFGRVDLMLDYTKEFQIVNRHVRQVTLFVVFIFLLFSAMVVFLINVLVVKPLHLIEGRIDSLAEGDEVPALSLPRFISHEIEAAANSVNQLSHALSEQRKAEEALRQSQKLDAIGQLTSGVAHEFNNLLTAIGGFARLIQRNPKETDKVKDHVELIVQASDQAGELTKQLLAFSRKQVLEPKVVRVGEVLDGLEGMLRPLLGEHVRLQVSVPDESICVEVDPAELTQALLNLALNARDAMPEGGNISIEAGLAEPGSQEADGFETMPSGRYAVISVADDGSGMDEETQKNIFEPFFTTKEPGEGTGLGLSMVHGMVHQLKGGITVESALGKGTIFKLYFPLADIVDLSEEKKWAGNKPAKGRETILVAEDELAVRQLARVVLEEDGYRVLMASNGQEALDLFRGEKGGIDLVLSDVTMPVMGGQELLEKLLKENPGLKFVFMSGYTSKIPEQLKARDHGDLPFLTKPFDPDHLCQLIRNTLDADF